MREMDWHKEWTTDSVLKSKYWLGDKLQVPFEEKMLAGMVLVVFICAFSYAAKSYAGSFCRQLRARQPMAVNIFVAVATLFVSKIFLDGFARKAKSVGIEIKTELFFTTIAEEVMELFAAAFVMGAVLMWISRKRGRSESAAVV